jgi:hypothetical protein
MAKWLEYITIGFFGCIALAIIYVKAGKSGQTGGQQTGAIISGMGGAASQVASALEGS